MKAGWIALEGRYRFDEKFGIIGRKRISVHHFRLPLCKNESWCETIHVKMLALQVHSHADQTSLSGC